MYDNVIPVENVSRLVSPYLGDRKQLRKRQSIRDLMYDIISKHRKNEKDCNRIAHLFWKGNVENTCRYLFAFCKEHIDYDIEDTLNQSVKSIGAILNEGKGDCKHYSQFIVGVVCALHRMGYPIRAKYRFALYNIHADENGTKSGHVFAVVTDKGKEIWVDPVLDDFNTRLPKYISHEDKIPPMGDKIGTVWEVNGFGNDTTLAGMNSDIVISGGYAVQRDQNSSTYTASNFGVGWVDQIYGFDDTVGKHKKRKHHGLHLKIRPGKLFKKFGLSTPRNAYLALLKMNAFHMASNIMKRIIHDQKARNVVMDKWKSLGGNPNKLSTALNQGLKVWNKHHSNNKISGTDDYSVGDMDYLGAAPAAIPALLAAAGPIILAFKSLLKGLGVGTPDKDAIDKADSDVVNKHNGATAEKGDGNADVQPDGSVDHGAGVTTKAELDPATGKQTLHTEVKDPTTTDDADTDEPDDDGGKTVTRTKTKTVTKHKSGGNGGGIMDYVNQATDWIGEHKVAVIGGTVAVVGTVVLVKVLSKKKGRR